MVVIASNYGQARHPAWYHNLRAHPRARMVVDGVEREVEAEEVASPERERFLELADRGLSRLHGATSQRAAPRRIAVFRLGASPGV